MYRVRHIVILIGAFLFATRLLYASDITSTHFIVRDPIIGTGGGYGSSASFQFFGAGNMIFSDGAGTSTSFKIHEGFLYYPKVTAVVLTATPTGSTGHLTWTAAVSNTGLGWTVSGYKTGIATVSGGPYTYTAVGNVLTYDYTGLTPGTYCFVVQTLDGLSYVIGTSNEQCITIDPTLTAAISQNTVDFGSLTSGSVRYATGGASSGGSTTFATVAHTIAMSTNAPNGYTLSYSGPTLTSNANTIAPSGTTITNSNSGTPGSAQFALSGTISGTGSMASGYNNANGAGDWKFVPNTVSALATASGAVTAGDTVSMKYLANIPSLQAAGNYTTTITYVITGSF